MLSMLERSGLKPSFLSIPRLVSPKAIPVLARTIRNSGCDVVHAHLEYAATLAPAAARLVGRPAVCTFHHIPHRLPVKEAVKERLAVTIASRSQAMIFVSSASMQAFAARYRSNPTSWICIHNGVDLSRFNPAPASFPPELGISEGSAVATLVAAMRGGKGHEAALAIWPSVVAQVPGARLLFIGSGPEEADLRRRADAAGMGDAVVFAGTRADVSRLIRASSLVLLPSESEALPTALIEAAACGRAAVATAVGGVPEVVSHGQTGLLVPVGDVRALSAAIVALLSDRERRVTMGTAARVLAEERFDMYRWARKLRSVYDGVVGGRPECRRD
jgi:glycosyltransferase involved in cell wall biosynthesis